MADLLSAIASIIAIIQISGTVLSVCYKYVTSVKNASRDIHWVINEVGSLKVILEELKSLESSQPHHSTLSKSLNAAHGPLKTCEAALKVLQDQLDTSNTFQKKIGAVVWPLREKAVDKIMKTIQRQKSNLIFALAADETRAIASIEEAMSQNAEVTSEILDLVYQSPDTTLTIRDDLQNAKESQHRENVLRWLRSTDPSTNHSAARKLHESLLVCPQYLSWRKGEGRVAWLNGISGCGISVLTSSIVEDIHAHRSATPGEIWAHYYFDFNETVKQQSSPMVQSVLGQLVNNISPLPVAVSQLYEACASGGRQPDSDAVMNALISTIQSRARVYIIVDALDESRERERLLDIVDLLHSTCPNVFLFVSSRRDHDMIE